MHLYLFHGRMGYALGSGNEGSRRGLWTLDVFPGRGRALIEGARNFELTSQIIMFYRGETQKIDPRS